MLQETHLETLNNSVCTQLTSIQVKNPALVSTSLFDTSSAFLNCIFVLMCNNLQGADAIQFYRQYFVHIFETRVLNIRNKLLATRNAFNA